MIMENEQLVVAKRIATALESIADQLAHLNDCLDKCFGADSSSAMAIKVVEEVRTRQS